MGLTYSEESQALVSVFKEYRNTINIYTEDTEDDKEFYLQLYQRLLNGTSCIINDITPLGDCDAVVRECDKGNDPRGLYIIDGDIYLIYQPKCSSQNLHVHNAYCIENLIIDKEAYVSLVHDVMCKKSMNEYRELLDVDNMFNGIIVPLIDLFLHYALEKKYRNAFTLKSIYCFCDQTKIPDIKVDVISKEIEKIKEELVPTYISDKQYNQELEKLKTQFPYSEKTLLKIVSGKDYLIPFMKCYANNKLNFKINLPKEGWKNMMARNCNLDKFIPLKEKMLALAESVQM